MKNVVIKNIPPSKYQSPKTAVNKTLQPTDWSNANVEAEAGETAMANFMGDGLPEFYKIAGRPHSSGGTPLNLPEDSFIYSKDKDLKIKDEFIQKMFGRTYKKGGYTPAELSAKYDINDFRKILADPNTDSLQRKTAELMIANYNEKLGKLALIQESKKGFPQGIPHVASPYIASTGFDPAGIYSTQGESENPEADNMQMGGQMSGADHYWPLPMAYAQYGGGMKGGDTYWPLTMAYAQAGGPQKNVQAYDPEEQAFLQTLSPGISLPQDTVENMQAQKEGTYGRFDKNAADKNWSWYGKPINWKNPEEVGKAQQAYNDRLYKKMIDADYSDKTAKLAVKRIGFVPEQDLPNSLDKLAGKYTETRRDFEIPKKGEQPAIKPFIEQQSALPGIPVNRLQTRPAVQESAPFWLQDVIQTAGAFGDLNRIKKYQPWAAPFEMSTMTPTYYDPTRELAANAEQSNIASQAAGMFAGPQALNARLSDIQGRATENAANILGKYNNLNVQTANEFERGNVGIKNANMAAQADRANNLYKESLITNQQFDNAKAQARQNLRNSLVQAITNRAQTQALNSIQDQYRVDPSTGGFKYFTKGKPLSNVGQQKTKEDMMNEVERLHNKGYSADLIKAIMGWK